MENILYNLTYILKTVFETYVIAKLMGVFLEKNKEKENCMIGIYLVRIVLCIVQYIYFPYLKLNLLTGILTLFMITLIYEGKMAKKVTIVIMITMSQIAAEYILILILMLCRYDFILKETGHNGNAFTFIALSVIFWIISEIIEAFKNIHNKLPVPNLFSGIIIVISIIMFVLNCIIFLETAMTDAIRLLLVICFLLILFLILYLYDSLGKNYTERIQTAIIERDKNYYFKQAELLQQSSKELIDFRHDSMNHLYVLRSLINDSDIEAIDYMNKMIGKIQEVKIYSNTGNVAIDSVINYKLSGAMQKNIKVKSHILLPNKIDFAMENLVVILGNLLDNAIEAADKVESDRYIDFEMRYKVGTVFICVKNSYDGQLFMQNGKIMTRKNDIKFHGIGLKSINSTVESNNGTMDIHFTDSEFVMKIMLYV